MHVKQLTKPLNRSELANISSPLLFIQEKYAEEIYIKIGTIGFTDLRKLKIGTYMVSHQ
jgi:hypothetical protein